MVGKNADSGNKKLTLTAGFGLARPTPQNLLSWFSVQFAEIWGFGAFSLFPLLVIFGGGGVDAWKRYNVANWRFNLETEDIFAIQRPFLRFQS